MVARHRIAVQVGMQDPYWVHVREAVIRHAVQRNVEVVQLGTPSRNITNLELLAHEIDEYFEELLVQDVHGLICNTVAEPLSRRIVTHGIPIIDAPRVFCAIHYLRHGADYTMPPTRSGGGLQNDCNPMRGC